MSRSASAMRTIDRTAICSWRLRGAHPVCTAAAERYHVRGIRGGSPFRMKQHVAAAACHRREERVSPPRRRERESVPICSRRLEVSDTGDGVDLGAKKIGTRTDGSSARRKQTVAVFRSVPPTNLRQGQAQEKSATAAARRSAITGTPPRTGSGQDWGQGVRGWRFDNREGCSTTFDPPIQRRPQGRRCRFSRCRRSRSVRLARPARKPATLH